MATQQPEPVGYYAGPVPKPYAGRRTGSVVFGVLAIVAGALNGCLGLMVPAALFMPQPGTRAPSHRIGTAVVGALTYLMLAAALIAFGIGAVRLRRWVRPLALTAGTLTVVTGVLGLVAVGLSVSEIRAKMAAGSAGAPGLPPGVATAFILGVVAFVGIVLVAIPATYVWFYRHPDTRDMLACYDPAPRWTDRCPIPVLGLVVGEAGMGVVTLISLPVGATPAFGALLTGWAAAGLLAAEGLAWLWLAWLAYRLRFAGWWGSLGMELICATIFIGGALRPVPPDAYLRAGFTPEEAAEIAQAGARGGFGTWGMGLTITLLAFAYLLYVRRYFAVPTAAVAPTEEVG